MESGFIEKRKKGESRMKQNSGRKSIRGGRRERKLEAKSVRRIK